jgi:hypothetical protein
MCDDRNRRHHGRHGHRSLANHRLALQIIDRHRATATVMNGFFKALVNESKQTPYSFASG